MVVSFKYIYPYLLQNYQEVYCIFRLDKTELGNTEFVHGISILHVHDNACLATMQSN